MAAARFGVLARQFSTGHASQALVKAPIQLFGVEGRYAHALYSAASKEKQLDKVETELKGFQALVVENAKLKDFMANPTVKRSAKTAILQDILANQKLSKISTNLLTALAENGRLQRMNRIFAAFGKIMSAHRGEVVCTVTTAKPLDAANLKELKTALGGFLKPGQILHLNTEVDPNIIGGMVVNIDDKYVDMSMASKINTYTNLINEAV